MIALPGNFRRCCAIFNPRAGRGRALRALRSIRSHFSQELQLKPTRFAGEAEELARVAALEGFQLVLAAGGDGTVHEVANGLLNSGNEDVAFAVLPVGSANDYAFALGVSEWWNGRRNQPLAVHLVDVGKVVGGGKSRFFVNGLGLGINGGVTLESRKISSLRGLPLYALATLYAIRRHFKQPRTRVELDGLVRENRTLALSVNLGQREGNFPITPNAKLDDGLFEIIHAGPLSRWEFARHLPAMATGKLPTNHPHVWLGQSSRVFVFSSAPVRVHLDGEFFCHPEDDTCELRIELLPRRLKVLGFPAGVWRR